MDAANKDIVKLQYINGRILAKKGLSYGILNLYEEEIVPFGKYDWISFFDERTELARVKMNAKRKCQGNISICIALSMWGIIDLNGKEILPLKYNNIWKFEGKHRDTTRVECGKEVLTFDIINQVFIPTTDYKNHHCANGRFYDIKGQGENWETEQGWNCYDEYGGAGGFDDFTIGEAFDGQVDAVWNID